MTEKDFWAPFGEKRWSAVRVLSVTDGIAEVNRVDPSSNQPKSRRTKVKASQLLKRDPALKGEDKPTSAPAEMFSEQTKREETRREKITRLFALIDDGSTIDDW